MNTLNVIKEELSGYMDSEKANFLPKYFQAYPGGYGEGDCFLGVVVPDQRKVAKKYYRSITLLELEKLLDSQYHEHRLTAVFMLVYKYQKAGSEAKQKEIVNFYLDNLPAINNWDLVDSSAPKILGPYLFNKDRQLLYQLADSSNLWEQRIAIMSTHYFIKQGDFKDTLNLADLLFFHNHDLIHKAVGWMLREVGKMDFETEFNYLQDKYKKMPRTMLRYAIEKFSPELRKKFLFDKITTEIENGRDNH